MAKKGAKKAKRKSTPKKTKSVKMKPAKKKRTFAKRKPAVRKKPIPKRKSAAGRQLPKLKSTAKKIQKKSRAIAEKPMAQEEAAKKKIPEMITPESASSVPSEPKTPEEMLAALEKMAALPAPKKAPPEKETAKPEAEPIEPEEAEKEKPEEARQEKKAASPPIPQKAPSTPAAAPPVGAFSPDLDTLPGWEGRHRLKRMIFEEGLTFLAVKKGVPESKEASAMLSKCAKEGEEGAPGYFIVCAKDRSGKVIGVLDGNSLDDGVVAISRSCAKDSHTRELHLLLYSAALTGRNASYVMFSTSSPPISQEFAGKLILLGRGFGMSAIPVHDPKCLFFLRRMGKELDPLSEGEEISKVLKALSKIEPALAKTASEFSKKGMVALIPLPISPDSREHLHELRDSVSSLGLKGELQPVLDSLRNDYLIERKDIAPSALF
ncbi:MAG: hypothetical protein V1827_05040 [Candidatus Micrarchaeota archaeon]